MNPGIEAARFVLAAAVVVFHWNGALPTAYLAVDLFFVVSGLVIGRRYEAAQRAGGSAADFAVGRAIRLYPLYLVGMMAGLLSHRVEAMVTGEWSYSVPGLLWRGALLLPVLSLEARPEGIQAFPLDVPAWSLWCEVLANLLFCLLCRAPRWVMAAPVVLGLMVLVSALAAPPYFAGGGDGRTVLTGLGRIGFSFFAGVLLARLRPGSISGWRAGLALLSMLGALLIYFRMTAPDDTVSILALLVVGFPLVTLGIAACQFGGPAARACIAAGSLSYALYITHWPLQRVLRSLSLADPGPWGAALVVLGLSTLAYGATEYVDRPIRRALRRYWMPVPPRPNSRTRMTMSTTRPSPPPNTEPP